MGLPEFAEAPCVPTPVPAVSEDQRLLQVRNGFPEIGGELPLGSGRRHLHRWSVLPRRLGSAPTRCLAQGSRLARGFTSHVLHLRYPGPQVLEHVGLADAAYLGGVGFGRCGRPSGSRNEGWPPRVAGRRRSGSPKRSGDSRWRRFRGCLGRLGGCGWPRGPVGRGNVVADPAPVPEVVGSGQESLQDRGVLGRGESDPRVGDALLVQDLPQLGVAVVHEPVPAASLCGRGFLFDRDDRDVAEHDAGVPGTGRSADVHVAGVMAGVDGVEEGNLPLGKAAAVAPAPQLVPDDRGFDVESPPASLCHAALRLVLAPVEEVRDFLVADADGELPPASVDGAAPEVHASVFLAELRGGVMFEGEEDGVRGVGRWALDRRLY